MRSTLQQLPGPVVDLLWSASIAEYATVSAAGVPIDTPVLYFPSEGLRTFDVATGLSYPAKAERARRNPKVGLLIEGGPGEPVISVTGRAAVRDSNLQANVERYLSEAGHILPGNPDWSLARQAVWYWTRIIVEITPVRLFWWDNPEAMDGPPHRWDAPANTHYPASDPAPPGEPSKPSQWEQPPWQALASQALARGGAGHLSVLDADGYPMPVRARSIEATEKGFSLELPIGLPWRAEGKASLTFNGNETFIGEATDQEGSVSLHVERVLPILPMTLDMAQLWEPKPNTRENLMRRLIEETERRGVPIPTIPVDRPPPTEGYRRRLARRSVILPADS
jgi:hypothetical protein